MIFSHTGNPYWINFIPRICGSVSVCMAVCSARLAAVSSCWVFVRSTSGLISPTGRFTGLRVNGQGGSPALTGLLKRP